MDRMTISKVERGKNVRAGKVRTLSAFPYFDMHVGKCIYFLNEYAIIWMHHESRFIDSY